MSRTNAHVDAILEVMAERASALPNGTVLNPPVRYEDLNHIASTNDLLHAVNVLRARGWVHPGVPEKTSNIGNNPLSFRLVTSAEPKPNYSLSANAWRVLFAVSEDTTTDLIQDHTGLSLSSIRRSCELLEAAGYVKRCWRKRNVRWTRTKKAAA